MPFLSCKEALSHPVSLSYNRNFSEVAFFVPLGNVLSPQFSFEKFLANTRLNILRVKGQCKLHFSLLSVVFHCCVWLLNLLHSRSVHLSLLFLSLLCWISWSSCFIHVHLYHCLCLSLHFVTPLSVLISSLSHCISDLPCILTFQQWEGASVCFSLFSCVLHSPLTKECMTLWGLCPLLTVKCTNKSTDGTLRPVCIANIGSLLSSHGMRLITLTES